MKRLWAASRPDSRSFWPAARYRSYIAMRIRIGKVVSLMRRTFKECSARGVRTKLAGLSMINARMLKGGWYENSASDFTLIHRCQLLVREEQRSIPFDGGYGELKQVLVKRKLSTSAFRPLLTSRLAFYGSVRRASVSNHQVSSRKGPTASILANVFDKMEIRTGHFRSDKIVRMQ